MKINVYAEDTKDAGITIVGPKTGDDQKKYCGVRIHLAGEHQSVTFWAEERSFLDLATLFHEAEDAVYDELAYMRTAVEEPSTDEENTLF